MIEQKIIERDANEGYIDYITRVTEEANRLTEDVINIIYPSPEKAIIICRDNPKKIMLGRFINKFVVYDTIDQGIRLFKKSNNKSNAYELAYDYIIPTNIILNKQKLYDLELISVMSAYYNIIDPITSELNPLNVVINTNYSKTDIQKIIDERIK